MTKGRRSRRRWMMASQRIWNVCYYLGTTGKIGHDSGNPHLRSSALSTAAAIERTGWHIWVEHATTGKRIYDNRDQSRPEGRTVVAPERRQKAGG